MHKAIKRGFLTHARDDHAGFLNEGRERRFPHEVMKKVFLQWGQIVAGLAVAAFGIHLTIFANIGLAPWDCLSMGISYHTPMNYGVSAMTVSILVLLIDLLMKERIGYGTIIDALLSGNLIQAYNDLNPFPKNENLWLGIVIMLIGFVFMAVGIWIYMSAGQCCGPRDALLVGLGKRMPRVPIGIVEILLWGVVVAAGWLLGGPVGVGTLISIFGAGLIMQAVYSVIRFEPRSIQNRDVAAVTKELLNK